MIHRQLTHNEHQYLGYKYPLAFMMDNIIDPRNVGSAFRLADALGVEKMYLIGNTPFPQNKIIRKTARGTEDEILWEYYSNVNDGINKVKTDGYSIISAEITDNSKDLSDYNFKKIKKICLAVGAENEGVSQKILNSSKDVIHIKMLGVNSSMNVTAALSIIAYQIINQWVKIIKL